MKCALGLNPLKTPKEWSAVGNLVYGNHSKLNPLLRSERLHHRIDFNLKEIPYGGDI